MSLMRLAAVRPDLATRETRTIVLMEDPAVAAPPPVPPGPFIFEEWYCVESGCDCRRVLIEVYSGGTVMLATISHAFEPPSEDKFLMEQTMLDPFHAQSPWAADLLDLFLHVLRVDPPYRDRLVKHYEPSRRRLLIRPSSCLVRRVRRDRQMSGRPGGGAVGKARAAAALAELINLVGNRTC